MAFSVDIYDDGTFSAGIGYGIEADPSGMLPLLIVLCVIVSIVAIVSIISLWKIFKKAGKKGWESIIPVYNMITLVEIVGKPMYYILFFFIPIAPVLVYIPLAEKFGKESSFGVLTYFFPFVCLPILAFGKNTFNLAPVATAPLNAPAQNVTETVTPAAPVATPVPAPEAPAAPAPETPVAAPTEPVAPVTPVAPTAPETPASTPTEQM